MVRIAARRIGLALAWIGLTVLMGCPPTPDKDGSSGITNEPPVPYILDPADGGRVNNPTAVTLRGGADDDEDGELVDDALSWSSDLDGELGTSGQLVVALSLGDHVLTLAATDSDGSTAEVSVSVKVTDENAPPVPVIDSPTGPIAYHYEGDLLTLVGHADDPEDGELPGSALFWSSDVDGSWGNGASVDVAAPNAGAHTVVLTAVDGGGETASTAITLNVVAAGSNIPPSAIIALPNNGDAFEVGETVSFVGESLDPEDGALAGGAVSWTSSLDGGLGTGTSVDTTLSQGVHTIAFNATDSGGETASDSIAVSVNAAGNQAPTVVLVAPLDGAVVNAGSLVGLVATANDPEDGPLSGSQVEWTSSLNGPLGDGLSLDVDTLTVGSHQVTVTGTDSGGAVGVDAIALTVLVANTTPDVEITSPASGSTYTAGDTIAFEGTAEDAEDGPLTGSAVLWQSSLDGAFGTGVNVSFASLSAGAHQITLSGADSQGAVGTDSIGVTIDPSAVNLDPVARLTGPEDALVGISTRFDATDSYDPDGTLDDLSLDFGDGTVVSGTDAEWDHTFQTEDTFTVVLTVTDDQGAQDVVSLQVSTTIPERVPEVVVDTADSLDTLCALDLDGGDNPHVAYFNSTHDQVVYAWYDGASWNTDLIDGPGYNSGYAVSPRFDLAVDGQGRANIVYTLRNGELWWARRSGNSWTRELVDELVDTNWYVALDFDPSQGDRPTVAYADDANGDAPTVAWRAGAGSWSTESHATGAFGFSGGFGFSPGGIATLTFGYYEVGSVRWSDSAGFNLESEIYDGRDGYDRHQVTFDASGLPVVAEGDGIDNFLGGSWIHSAVANFSSENIDVGIDPTNDEVVAAFRNDQGLVEIIRPGVSLRWRWEYNGPMDTGFLSLDVASTGETRACMFRDRNLLVY